MVSRFAGWFSRKGLQVQFIVITMCAIVAVMSILGYLAVHREKSLLYEEVDKQGRLLGETLAIPIINDLIYEKLGLVEEGGLLDNYILEIFSRQDLDLLYMAILDEQGRVISHNDITEYGKPYSDPLTRKALDGDRTIVQRFARGEHDALDVGVPLSIGKKRWGTLKLGISLEKADHRILATVGRIVLLTILLLSAGFAIVLLLSRRFIGPITQLANTMEKAHGDIFDLKVPVRGQDELAVLADRFNSMIDRIRQANEELKKTHEKLVQSEKLASIGVLAAGVAHEINNPLGGIFNCLRMLQQDSDDPARREKYLGLVKEGMDRIESTVSRLLWMSRKADHRPTEVNIRDAVEKAHSLLSYKLGKRRIAFANEVPGDLCLTVDMHDLQQLLLNLYINAIDAMGPEGVLTVEGSRNDSTVVLEVADTGCGIDPANVHRVFDPFFTTKPPGEGTGLGLWLTYEIVRNYSGEIHVESQPRTGSRFTMSFPARQSR
ncbi:MAG TPA: ATP-binding protein [Bacteroidota bacterium]|nr:ATP-binding protein [Bacteroidota bacterium]